jgi:hypothetical protein
VANDAANTVLVPGDSSAVSSPAAPTGLTSGLGSLGLSLTGDLSSGAAQPTSAAQQALVAPAGSIVEVPAPSASASAKARIRFNLSAPEFVPSAATAAVVAASNPAA